MAGYIVILYPPVVSNQFFPIENLSPFAKPYNGKKVCKKHITQNLLIKNKVLIYCE